MVGRVLVAIAKGEACCETCCGTMVAWPRHAVVRYGLRVKSSGVGMGLPGGRVRVAAQVVPAVPVPATDGMSHVTET